MKIYIYVVDRDFGFAPNPFHGICTLATCKPRIRSAASVGDWIVGMGGCNLKATGKCVFAMQVTEKMTFDEYWSNKEFADKKPVRNGSRRMMIGDNIYHHDSENHEWRQENSHHSNPDGSINPHNLKKDTNTDKVLISRNFFYFGDKAPVVPPEILDRISYKNARNHRVYDEGIAGELIEWIYRYLPDSLNQVMGDPFDFEHTEKRYTGQGSRIA